jgi:hypothetical protein
MSNRLREYNTPEADEVIFWKDQFIDHASFLFELTTDDNLKSLAYEEHQIWVNETKNIYTFERLKPYVMSLKKLKMIFLNQKLSGKDIGPIYLSLIEHMLYELDYFVSLMIGTMDLETEIKFWLKEDSDHTSLAAHLLDPAEKSLTYSTFKMSNDLHYAMTAANTESIRGAINILKKSNAAAIKMLAKKQNDPTISLLSPEMISHEIDETAHALERLSNLLNTL